MKATKMKHPQIHIEKPALYLIANTAASVLVTHMHSAPSPRHLSLAQK